MRKKLSIIFTFIISASFCQDSLEIQNNFKKQIDNIYNFHVQKLSKEEHLEVTKNLDTLFKKIESDTTLYLPLLREELKTDGHFPYFYYDCSHLLMLKSEKKSDLQICANAFIKCDIKEVGRKEYVQLNTFLAKNGIDVTKSAIKILDDSSFEFLADKHFFTYTKSYCLLYCLHNLNPQLYTETLISYFNKTKDEDAQRAIITVLWFSYSCKGDEFLKSLNKKTTLNKHVLEYSKNILTYDNMNDMFEMVYEKIQGDDLLDFKNHALSNFTDEAINELDFVTKAQRRKGKCN
jgi:hypothetical protein